MVLVLSPPERGITRQQFEIEEVDALSPETSGRLGGVTLGFPLWRARWELSRNLTRDMSDEWRAFFSRLRKSKRPFLAYDRDRLFPRAYPQGFATMTKVGGAAFDGTGDSWAQTIDADGNALLDVEGLPSGLHLQQGDYVGFKWDSSGATAGTYDRRAMVRVVDPAYVAADGGVTVMVEMPVPTAVVPAGAIAHLDRPACVMRMVSDESSLGSLDRRQKIAGGTLSALQDLRT